MPATTSVRLAMASDAPAIAALQHERWQQSGIDIGDTSTQWEAAVTRPPLAQMRVLVAITPEGVTGFAAIGPSADPDADPTDGEVAEFIATGDDADRLLHACANTLRTDGFTRARWWIRSTDDDRRAWLTATGWAPDGAHQEVGDGDVRWKLLRLHTGLDSAQGE